MYVLCMTREREGGCASKLRARAVAECVTDNSVTSPVTHAISNAWQGASKRGNKLGNCQRTVLLGGLLGTLREAPERAYDIAKQRGCGTTVELSVNSAALGALAKLEPNSAPERLASDPAPTTCFLSER